MPRATIFERMERLRKDGFIKKYTVDLNYEKLGYSVLSYILIQYDSKSKTDQRTLCNNLAKHGIKLSTGFGIGIERFTRFICGVERIEDVSPFPKIPGKISL